MKQVNLDVGPVFRTAQELWALNRSVSVLERVAKLAEETGEVAQTVLRAEGASNASATASANVLEELVDVIIVALDLAAEVTGVEACASAPVTGAHQLQVLLNQKVAKWRAQRQLPALEWLPPT